MRLALPALICVVASSCSCGPSALASSSFEGGVEGWLLSGNGDGTSPNLERAGGNPGGHLCGVDARDGDTWYFVAPPKYVGNRSAAFGTRLTFDLRQFTIFNQIRGRDVVLNGGGLALNYNFRAPPGLDWTPFSVSLQPGAGWVTDATGQPSSEEDIKIVLRALTSLRIRGEYYDGPDDIACLDNVYFGTQ